MGKVASGLDKQEQRSNQYIEKLIKTRDYTLALLDKLESAVDRGDIDLLKAAEVSVKLLPLLTELEYTIIKYANKEIHMNWSD